MIFLSLSRQADNLPSVLGVGEGSPQEGGGPQPDASGSVRGVKDSSRGSLDARGPVPGVQLAFDSLDCGACGVLTNTHFSIHTKHWSTTTFFKIIFEKFFLSRFNKKK